jgi:DNA polymerase-3 subunit delta
VQIGDCAVAANFNPTPNHWTDAQNKNMKLVDNKLLRIAHWVILPHCQSHLPRKKSLSLLVELTGNNTRLAFTELEKLRTYAQGETVNADMVRELVSTSAANNLQLANAIRLGNISQALELVENLIRCNEPALRIVATLITSFRTWLVVKLMVIAGEKDDSAVAQIAELKNPKRLYYIRQEVKSVNVGRLQSALKLLLELELMLKRSGDEKLALQTQIIKLCS